LDATSIAFAKARATIVISGRHSDEGQKLAAELRSLATEAEFVTAYTSSRIADARYFRRKTFGAEPNAPFYQLLSQDLEGLPAFWTKAKYGKMSIEGGNPVNTETPHYSEAGAVDDRKILVTPRIANIPGNLQVRQSDRFD
jgi:hypothetical protein